LKIHAYFKDTLSEDEDLALLYRIMAGPDGRDTEVPPVPVAHVPELELKDLRIAFAPTFSEDSGCGEYSRCRGRSDSTRYWPLPKPYRK
jgi:hypothetical protein